MRTCFSNPKVEGLIFWNWFKRKMWQSTFTSYFADSLLVESAVGKKWREVRAEWKTSKTGKTDANGKYSFNGYQGKYIVEIKNGGSIVTDTFYLEPGTGAKEVSISPVGIIHNSLSGNTKVVSLRMDNRTIKVALPPIKGKPVFLSTYSVSGKLLSKTSLNIDDGVTSAATVAPGCRIFRVGSLNQTYYTGIGLQCN